ncbi:hypothetical protein ACFV8X_35495, partial [Streptomyces sp. NPDC059868]
MNEGKPTQSPSGRTEDTVTPPGPPDTTDGDFELERPAGTPGATSDDGDFELRRPEDPSPAGALAGAANPVVPGGARTSGTEAGTRTASALGTEISATFDAVGVTRAPSGEEVASDAVAVGRVGSGEEVAADAVAVGRAGSGEEVA